MSGLVTVRIEKDNNYTKYIKIIKEYDNLLSIAQIKKAIDTGDVVFSFDTADTSLVADGKTSKLYSREDLFRKCLKKLKTAGAKMVVTEEEYDIVWEEYSSTKIKKTIKSKKTAASVMAKIEERWNLPSSYLEYLRNRAESQYVEIENEETLERIEICLYGAKDLIEGQSGYSYNPVEKAVIEDWDPNFVVIANFDADPFCIDISEKNSPVYYAMHGMDEWCFDEYCDSLETFLKLAGCT